MHVCDDCLCETPTLLLYMPLSPCSVICRRVHSLYLPGFMSLLVLHGHSSVSFGSSWSGETRFLRGGREHCVLFTPKRISVPIYLPAIGGVAEATTARRGGGMKNSGPVLSFSLHLQSFMGFLWAQSQVPLEVGSAPVLSHAAIPH